MNRARADWDNPCPVFDHNLYLLFSSRKRPQSNAPTCHPPPGAATRHPKLCLSPHTRYSSIHSQVPGLGHRVPGAGTQAQVQARTRIRPRKPRTRLPISRDLRPEDVTPPPPTRGRHPPPETTSAQRGTGNRNITCGHMPRANYPVPGLPLIAGFSVSR